MEKVFSVLMTFWMLMTYRDDILSALKTVKNCVMFCFYVLGIWKFLELLELTNLSIKARVLSAIATCIITSIDIVGGSMKLFKIVFSFATYNIIFVGLLILIIPNTFPPNKVYEIKNKLQVY